MDLHIGHRVVLAVVRDLCAAPQAPEKRDRFVHSLPSFADRHAACPELLRILAADADPEDDASAGGSVEVGDLLGNDGRRVEG